MLKTYVSATGNTMYIYVYMQIYMHMWLKLIKKVAMKRIGQHGNDWKEEKKRKHTH